MPSSSGTVDFRDDHFVVSCPFDGRVHAELRALPKHEYDRGEWRVPRHVRSVARLMAVVRRLRWQLTRPAREALAEIREAAERAELYVQLVHGSFGEPWLKCRVDDADLHERVAGLPGAELDDETNTWIVPATTVEACAAVAALVDDEPRFEVDPAARRLLDEPEDLPELTPRLEEEPAAPAPTVTIAAPRTANEVAAAFEREQELLAWSRAVIADAQADGIAARLRPYQRAGVRYLCSAQRAFLADDKGLGKRLQALAAIDTEAAYPALVLCTDAAEPQWEREMTQWLPEGRTYAVADGASAHVPQSDVVVVQYDLLHRLRDELKARRFCAIVADDSDQLRNERSLKTRAALEVAETVSGLRLCLSSKVLLEQPIHLLPQLLFLDRVGDLSGRNAFIDRYCRPRYDVSGTRYGAAHVAELEQRLRASCLCRRELAQVRAQLPLPSRYRQAVRAASTPEQRALESALLADLRTLRESEVEAQSAEEARTARQALEARFDALSRLTGERKVEGVAAWIDRFLLSGEWLAVLVRHPEVGEALESRYPDAVCVRASGVCMRAGVVVNPFYIADARLVFLEQGAQGAALRLARGRHLAIADLDARGYRELLRDAKPGEHAGATWYLESDLPLDQALSLARSEDGADDPSLASAVAHLLREEREHADVQCRLVPHLVR